MQLPDIYSVADGRLSSLDLEDEPSGRGMPISSPDESESASPGPGGWSCFFFHVPKSDGNGWLSDLPWDGREGRLCLDGAADSESDELVSI